MKALKRSKFLALTLALVLVLLCIPTPAAAATFSDISGHWAEAAILRWSEMGVLSGYPDGTFRPDDTVKRGELATIINNLMHFPDAPEYLELFTDLDGKWYASDVNALALRGAYLVTHGEAAGDAALTREEAMAMVYNAFLITLSRSTNRFSDSDSMNEDYAGKINTMYSIGLISGFPDGSFHPKEPITRAQVMTILNNMIDEYITKPGIYEGLDRKRVLVAAPGVEIRNTEPIPFLVVSPEASLGSTTLTGYAIYATRWYYINSGTFNTGSRTIASAYGRLHDHDTRFAGGTGLEDYPYLISNQTQLALLDEYITDADVHFALANDITLTGQWTPLGYSNASLVGLSDPFRSTLDGRGYAINGMSITSDIQNGVAVGLFAAITYSASISNLTVSGEISLSTSADFRCIGGMCGYQANGTIENCVSHVNISINSTGTAFSGGVVGLSERGTISKCRADGNISVIARNPTGNNAAYAGGIVGYVESTSGSSIGSTMGMISSCESHADVQADAHGGSYAGGIAGRIGQQAVFDCQSDGIITATSASPSDYGACAGGVAGLLVKCATIQGCVSRADITATASKQAHAGGIIGYAEGMVINQSSVIGSCEAYCNANAICLGSADNTNSDAGGIVGWARHLRITDCRSNSTVTAIGGYHSNAGGLSSTIGSYTEPSMACTVSNCYTSGQVSAEGGRFQNNAGGFSGQLHNSTIENCWSDADVIVGRHEGAINVAGGFSSGVYMDSVLRNCYATGSVTDNGIWFLPMVGSLTGRLEGSVISCYATGKTTVIDYDGRPHPYNTIVGSRRGEGGRITQCVDITDNDSGNPYIINELEDRRQVISNLTPTQTTHASTYTAIDWDFDTIWTMPDASDSYNLPILQGVFEAEQRAQAIPSHLR